MKRWALPVRVGLVVCGFERLQRAKICLFSSLNSCSAQHITNRCKTAPSTLRNLMRGYTRPAKHADQCITMHPPLLQCGTHARKLQGSNQRLLWFLSSPRCLEALTTRRFTVSARPSWTQSRLGMRQQMLRWHAQRAGLSCANPLRHRSQRLDRAWPVPLRARQLVARWALAGRPAISWPGSISSTWRSPVASRGRSRTGKRAPARFPAPCPRKSTSFPGLLMMLGSWPVTQATAWPKGEPPSALCRRTWSGSRRWMLLLMLGDAASASEGPNAIAPAAQTGGGTASWSASRRCSSACLPPPVQSESGRAATSVRRGGSDRARRPQAVKAPLSVSMRCRWWPGGRDRWCGVPRPQNRIWPADALTLHVRVPRAVGQRGLPMWAQMLLVSRLPLQIGCLSRALLLWVLPSAQCRHAGRCEWGPGLGNPPRG